jgi:hypothetical protein
VGVGDGDKVMVAGSAVVGMYRLHIDELGSGSIEMIISKGGGAEAMAQASSEAPVPPKNPSCMWRVASTFGGRICARRSEPSRDLAGLRGCTS